MPNINLVPVPLYDPLHPYHWEYDNLPLQNLKLRDELINYAVDINTRYIRDAIGTQGTLANRLNQSLEQDGSLNTEAVDDALHSIGAHTDGEWDGEDYVRMLLEERTKLEGIADEATALSIEVQTPSETVLFDDGTLILADSQSVTWQVIAPNVIKANLGFPLEAAHRHYYGIEPETEDFENFTTPSSTAFSEDSLRVYINGVRIFSDVEVYVPGVTPEDSWVSVSFTPDAEGGTFVLSTAITEDDAIRIDFDILLD